MRYGGKYEDWFLLVEISSVLLGVTTFAPYRVVRRASKCPQTRMNTGFFIELLVAGDSAVLPDIGKFGAKIGAAIRQILDRIVVDDRRFKGALEQFNSEI